MPSPQMPSLPWTRAEVQALIPQAGFTWRQRTVLLALVVLARPDGRVYYGNRRLAEVASQLAPAVAAEMGLSRKHFPVIDRAYLVRLLALLVRRGIVDRFWPKLGPTRRWHRVLRLRVEGLRAVAAWGKEHYRPWRCNSDPTPMAAPEPRVYSCWMKRISSRQKQLEHEYTAKEWRQNFGAEWESTG
ncbi:MAG: hypothetical protein K8T20_12905 [Planctomycetes bacterium]|nr:hypothetical protein [Planctomycetota bacterium]